MITRAFALAAVLAGCWACAPDGGPQGASGTDLAAAAVADNMQSTEVTALVSIVDVSVTDETIDGDQLVAIAYTAEVLEAYAGSPPATIRYIQYAESREDAAQPSSGAQIVSVCRELDGDYYLPDVGYELPARDALEKAAVAAAENLTGDRGSACR